MKNTVRIQIKNAKTNLYGFLSFLAITASCFFCQAQIDSIPLGRCGTNYQSITEWNEPYIWFINKSDTSQNPPSNVRHYLDPNAFANQDGIILCGDHFRIYYDDFNHDPIGFNNPADGQTRRDILCAVFTYVESVLDFSHLQSGERINIFVDQSFEGATAAPTTIRYLALGGCYDPYFNQQGVHAGNMFNHLVAGQTDPPANSYDGYLQVNFDKYWDQSTSFSIDYWESTSPIPSNSCQYDLYSVILHEVTHMLGWISYIRPINGLASATNNCFSLFDWLFLYQGDITNPTTLQKIVTGSSMNNPSLNTSLSPVSLVQNDIWLYETGTPNNHPVFSGFFNFSPSPGNNWDDYGFLSHLNYNFLSYTAMAQFSPGFQAAYVMGPFFAKQEMRRSWTHAELRALGDLGYAFSGSFLSDHTLNPPDQNSIVLNNSPAYRSLNINPVTRYTQGTNASNYYPESHAHVSFTPTQAIPSITIDINNDPGLANWDGLSDDEGDPITIMDGSLFGIRGVSDGTNSHAKLDINPSKTGITYTPEPGYVGLAQFGFNLWDGHEMGAFVVYSIEVLPDPNFHVNIGDELVINGGYEDGTEVRQNTATNSNISNSTLENEYIEGHYHAGDHFSGAHPYSYLGNHGGIKTGGTYIINSDKACGVVSATFTPGSFGIKGNSSNSSYPNSPHSPLPINMSSLPNERYEEVWRNGNAHYSYSTLKEEIECGTSYTFECDLAFHQFFGYTQNQNYDFSIVFTSDPGTNPDNVTIYQTVNFTVDHITAINTDNDGTQWQHFTGTFNYCSPTPARYFVFQPANLLNQGRVYIDNLSIKENTLPLIVSINGGNTNCQGGSSTLQAQVLNTTCNISYLWSNGSTSQEITVAPSITTTYTVTASICSDITASDYITIGSSVSLTAAITGQTNVSCNGGNNGSAMVTASGGTTPYTYHWSNNGTTATITGLTAGTYNVTVTDNNGCTAMASATITQPTTALTAAITAQTNVSCNGGNNGSATVTASGGTSPYTYHWSNNGTTATITGLTAGTYNITVTDNKGCTAFASVTITQPATFIASISSFTDNCLPGTNGSATVLTTGGTLPCSYLWSNGSTTNTATNLAAGSYSVTCTDAHSCTALTSVVIINKPLNVTASLIYQCEKNVCNINQTVTCGNPPYSYLWSNGATSEAVTGLDPGNYSVTVTDGSGPHVYNYTVYNAITPPEISPYASSTCGTGPIQYEIQNPDPNMVYTWSLIPSNAGTITGSPGTSVTIQWNTSTSAVIQILYNNPVTGCSGTASFNVFEACDNPPVGNQYLCNVYSSTASPAFTAGTTYSNKTYVVNGYFKINTNTLTFSNCTFYMGPLSNIQIGSGITTTFNNCYFLSDSVNCRYMWDGMYVTNSSSLINMTSCKIRDAINGLVSKNGGQITQYMDYLFKNYRCMQVMDYTPPAGNNINVTLKQCTLRGVASLPYAPWNGSPSVYGLYVKNIGAANSTNGILIGDVTSLTTQNLFKDFRLAVDVCQSNIQMYNNKITYSLGSGSNTAIRIAGANLDPNPKYTAVIGASTSAYHPNTIENYKYGISAYNGLDLNVSKNTLTNCEQSVCFGSIGTHCTSANTVTVYANTISSGTSKGIYATSNPMCNATIYCNNITMAANASNTAIDLTGTAINNSNEIYTVNNNTINAFNGIHLLNIYAINATSNNITLQNNATGSRSYGIQAQNCDNQNVNTNTITGTLNRVNKVGISIESTTHPFYRCNSISYVNWGFNIAGSNANPNQLISIFQNTFSNCDYGMVKNSSSGNAGSIGPQGDATHPWLNKFIGLTTHTALITGIPYNDYCYARNVTNEWFNQTPGVFTRMPVACNPCTVPLCSATSCPRETLSLMQSAATENSVNLAAISSISTSALALQSNIISNTLNFSEVGWFMARQKVFAQILARKDQYTQNAAFNNFMNSSETNSIGLLYFADLNIGNVRIDSANYYNQLVNPVSTADSLHKLVNDYYISYLRNHTLPVNTVTQLRDIAHLCPFAYGDGVYIARGLLSRMDSLIINYTNECETGTMQPKTMLNSGTSYFDNEDVSISLFPNPANNEVTIEFVDAWDNRGSVLFMLYDLMGKKWIEQTITQDQPNQVDIKGIAQGVYVYKFIYKGKELKTDKLVIIK